MRRFRLAAPTLAVALFFLSQAASAQTGADAGVDPDRPDLTDSPTLITPGIVQMEMGVMQTRQTAADRDFQSVFAARIGVRPWFEAQIATTGIMSHLQSGALTTGGGDVQVSAKLRLLASPAGEALFTILPAISLAVADEEQGRRAGDADYSLNMITGWDAGSRTRVDVNYVIGAIGDGDERGHFVQHTVSVSAGFEATERLTPYFEGFAISREERDGGIVTAINGGVIYRIGPRMAIDGGMIVGLSEDAPSYAVFGGFSVAVGRGRTKNAAAHRPSRRGLPTSVSAFRDRD